MNRQYATSNQGEAAFLMAYYGNVTETFARELTLNGRNTTRYYFLFDIDEAAGRTAARDYYEKKAMVEPYAYYGFLIQLRGLVWACKNQKPTETKEAEPVES